MSIKNLFGKKSISISANGKSSNEFEEVESIEYIEEFKKERIRFIPEIDFENPENFIRYGSAKKYYEDSIDFICKTYPYDGSLYEKQKWKNESSDLVNYIFDKTYPKNNGYINLGIDYGNEISSNSGYTNTDRHEYIYFKGTFNDGNKYEPENNREFNLKLDGTEGATVEFYFKKENLSGSSKQVIFDLWNGNSFGSNYGRLKIEIHPGISGEEDKFYVDISSGSSGIISQQLGSSLDFSSWSHYGIAFKNYNSNLKIQLFKNGDQVDEVVVGTEIQQVKGALQAHIGSLITTVNGTTSDKGWGKLSGSLDEFRYWKIKRTDKEIARNYFCQVAGGTNTDDANTDLGIYFKFNEGIYSNENISNFDKIVLDYSGRASNGNWTGYSLNSRNSGSAIVESGNAKKEEKDPIVYITHSDIVSLRNSYSEKAEAYDYENNANLYNTLPSWISDEDSENGNGARELLQIMSTIFDDLHNKIKFLPTIKDIKYSQEKPQPFSLKVLQNSGFEISDIFNDVSELEIFLNKNESETYEEKIYNIKNYIFQNIYNNILQIYKSKGTEKSFRNLIRCFGIDEELLRMTMLADNVEYTFDERYKYSAVKRKIINFNNPDFFSSCIVQQKDLDNQNSIGYIPRIEDVSTENLRLMGSTFQTSVIFPKKFKPNETLFFPTNFFTSSVFGIHEGSNGTYLSPGVFKEYSNFLPNDRASIQFFAVRPELESPDVYFQVSSSCFNINLTSSLYKNVYDDSVWNFALRIKPEKYPMAAHVQGAQNGDYILELFGTSFIQDIENEYVLLTASIPQQLVENYYDAQKMVYVGAHLENFSGSAINITNPSQEEHNHNTDVQMVYFKYWNSYLSDETVRLHAKDIDNYGANDPQYKTALQQVVLNYTGSAYEEFLPQSKTLAFYWNFTGLSTTTEDFFIKDSTSGSFTEATSFEEIFGRYTRFEFNGKSKNFPTTEGLRNQYLNSAKQQLPETLNSNELVEILEQDDEFFTKQSKPVNHYFMIEKSMYSNISKEMLNWVGTVREFNNLVGSPKYRYEEKYKEMDSLRSLFFSKVEEEPNFERFVDFYKWIDDSVSFMVQQIIPASTNYSPGVTNTIESHILERNKYRHKLPTIEFAGEPPIDSARSINALLYDWKYNSAPLSGKEKNNCSWWKLRAERTNITNGNISNVDLNEERVGIFNVSTTALNRHLDTIYNLKIGLYGPVSIYEKKRELGITIQEVGFDLTGNDYYEITDILPANFDCEDIFIDISKKEIEDTD